MTTKQELEEKLVSVTKELNNLIFEFHRKFKDLLEEQNLIKLKLEKGKYDDKTA